MKHMVRNSRGFNLTLVLVIVVIVGVIAASAIWLLSRDEDGTSATARQNTGQTKDESNDKETQGSLSERHSHFSGFEPKTGSGSVSLIEQSNGSHVLQLDDDFMVQEGPDLYIGFGNGGEVDKNTMFSKLTSFTGGQQYDVPSTIDTSKYGQVFIYCKEFSTPFAAATFD